MQSVWAEPDGQTWVPRFEIMVSSSAPTLRGSFSTSAPGSKPDSRKTSTPFKAEF